MRKRSHAMLIRAQVFLVLALLPFAPVQAASSQQILLGQPSDYTSAIAVAGAMIPCLQDNVDIYTVRAEGDWAGARIFEGGIETIILAYLPLSDLSTDMREEGQQFWLDDDPKQPTPLALAFPFERLKYPDEMRQPAIACFVSVYPPRS